MIKMWCNDCNVSGVELTRRTNDEITIVIGECRVCHKQLVEKWRKVRAYSVKQPSKDIEVSFLRAENLSEADEPIYK
jgi:hypothetical protein